MDYENLRIRILINLAEGPRAGLTSDTLLFNLRRNDAMPSLTEETLDRQMDKLGADGLLQVTTSPFSKLKRLYKATDKGLELLQSQGLL